MDRRTYVDRVGLAGMLEFRPTPFKREESEP
jgi:hypothetical protein